MERRELDRHYSTEYTDDHEYLQFGSMKVDHFHPYFALQLKLGYKGTYCSSQNRSS
jgi:hypothetical protein